ncbi:Protein NHR-76 [Aphelenchoides avenae]|nr:Protein NHR-76 [Aphelenchus avenae]
MKSYLTRKRNLLDLALERYAFNKEHRRLLFCPRSLRALVSGEQPIPERHSLENERHKALIHDKASEIALYISFIQCFEAYQVLSVDDKLIIAKKFLASYFIFEQFYITYENRGHITGRVHLNNYTWFPLLSYSPSSDPEHERWQPPAEEPKSPYSDASSPSYPCKSSASRSGSTNEWKCVLEDVCFDDLLQDTYKNTMRTLVEAMSTMKMTDVEFVGISLMLLFDPNTDGLSEIAKLVLTEARNQLSVDWLDAYKQCGIANGDERMGSSVLLLPTIQEAAHDHRKIYHMIRLFGRLDYDKMFDEFTL